MLRKLGSVAVTLFVLFTGTSFCTAQSFEEFVDQLNSTASELKSALVDSFLISSETFPLIEGSTTAIICWRGEANRVEIRGDMTSWDTLKTIELTRITDTDLWFVKQTFEPDARVEYKIVVDDTNWVLDPLNPNGSTSPSGTNSELIMPEYIPPHLIRERIGVEHGTIEEHSIHSETLASLVASRPELPDSIVERPYRVYLPVNYNPDGIPYPVLFVHDGFEYLEFANIDTVLDNLIDDGLIQPIVAVFVPPIMRTPEYADSSQDSLSFNHTYAEFFSEELGDRINRDFNVRTDPLGRAVLGPSYGGNISLVCGVFHPERFGHVAAQSPYAEPALLERLATGPKLNIDFYIDLGRYDIDILLKIVPEQLIPILKERGYNFEYLSFSEGHSWKAWRANVDRPLIQFFAVE